MTTASNQSGTGPADTQPNPELEARVAARTEELSLLSTELLRLMEAERSELAKELHDELGGLITAAKMDMSWLQSHIGEKLDAPGQEKMRSVVQMLNQAMTLKRRVVEDLRPSLLDHFGLSVALRSHFEERCRSAAVECIVTLPEDLPDLESTAQLTLFRVAQEALANLLKRGGAKHVELVIEPEVDGYLLTIGDDSAAMDASQQRALTSMRHRMLGAGGKLEVTASPGQGNRITAYVPRSPAK
ncbi:MAG: histidine kinase [Pseudomonadota bacterium]